MKCMVSNGMAKIDHGLDINGPESYTKWGCWCGEPIDFIKFYLYIT